MVVVRALTLARQLEDAVEYVEVADEGGPPMATLSIQSSLLPAPAPESIRITVDWAAGQRTPPKPRLSEETFVQKRTPMVGDTVVVVKSGIAGVKSPPEVLEQ